MGDMTQIATKYLTKTIYLWLIIYIGLVMPLVYVHHYSPHGEAQLYQLTLFEQAPRTLPAELLAKLAGRADFVTLNETHPLNYHAALPTSIDNVLQSLQQSYTFITLYSASYHPSLSGSLVSPLLCENSAWVAQPDKPPRWLIL